MQQQLLDQDCDSCTCVMGVVAIGGKFISMEGDAEEERQ